MRYLKLVLFAIAVSAPTSYAYGGEVIDQILRDKAERKRIESTRSPNPRYFYPKPEISTYEQIYDYYLARDQPFGQWYFDSGVQLFSSNEGLSLRVAQGFFNRYEEEGGTEFTTLPAFRLGIARKAGALRNAKP
jgi:hypothetical protein